MSKSKNESFVFYRSFFDAIDAIPDEKLQAQVYKTITSYGLFGVEPEDNADLVIKVIFAQAKILLDNARKRYENCVENGKKGGRPKTEQNQEITKSKPRDNQEETKEKPKANLNDNVNVNINNNIKERNKQREKANQNTKNNDPFIISLKNKYPNITIDTDIDQSKYDTKLLEHAIEQSPDFLQGLALSTILAHYSEVIAGKYKQLGKSKQDIPELHYMTRNYSPEELNNLFENYDELKEL